MKICNKCKCSKECSRFSKNGTGLHSICKDCKKVKYQENRLKILADKKKYYRSNRLRIITSNKKHYEENREILCERSRAKYDKEYARSYRQKNKPLIAYHSAKRRAAILERTPKWANSSLISTYYQIAARLTICLQEKMEVDHIVPLQGSNVSGLHTHSNLQIIPKKVNIAKSNRYLDNDIVSSM